MGSDIVSRITTEMPFVNSPLFLASLLMVLKTETIKVIPIMIHSRDIQNKNLHHLVICLL